MSKLYDFIGIGIGPYNLSLAALTEDMHDIDCIFFDESSRMQWHPGMLIEGTDLQVPFLADLVTFADPTSRFSFLNYLKQHNRLYKFFFFHTMEVPRQEYSDYLKWAANQISGLYFGKKVVDVIDQDDHYEIVTQDSETGTRESCLANHIVMATGSEPLILENMQGFPDKDVIHTSQYLYEKEALMESDHITVVGSGQSAAEVFYDLLEEREDKEFQLTWLTRSKGIFQLEAAKLGQEFFSPDYVDYFHKLPLNKRKEALDTLEPLRNGVAHQTLNGIYEMLYHYSIGGENPKVNIQLMTEVQDIQEVNDQYILNCHQWQTENDFQHKTEKVILATGYKPNIPDWFIERFKEKVVWEDDMMFEISRNYELKFKKYRKHRFYAVTNLEHSHGTAATNLVLAVQRNMEIINHMTGEARFDLDGVSVFQQFNQL
ncbi:lysine N(6)-hydroxylase/L-ornithine N(5)-oxygenase family protein [Virgibacillus indicus]|uniref:lysine N(6)-hydroxylase/L-ornithine N(5)-oxygenase family protein n=1 Tax=Virgibacillus indicus TaxID=2024554 RepID=UPI0026A9804C